MTDLALLFDILEFIGFFQYIHNLKEASLHFNVTQINMLDQDTGLYVTFTFYPYRIDIIQPAPSRNVDTMQHSFNAMGPKKNLGWPQKKIRALEWGFYKIKYDKEKH